MTVLHDYGRALIVEDNSVNQLVALEMLKQFKVHVDTADDGQQACDKFRANSYDYIFMDAKVYRVCT